MKQPYLHNGDFYTLEGGVDTNDDRGSSDSISPLETWDVFKPYYKLIEDASDHLINVINQVVSAAGEQVDLSCRMLSLMTVPRNWILNE